MKIEKVKPVTVDEENKIKELYALTKRVSDVCSSTGRSKWTVYRVLFGLKQEQPAKEGCFDWRDYKNSMI